jgi:hypothetical protein
MFDNLNHLLAKARHLPGVRFDSSPFVFESSVTSGTDNTFAKDIRASAAADCVAAFFANFIGKF